MKAYNVPNITMIQFMTTYHFFDSDTYQKILIEIKTSARYLKKNINRNIPKSSINSSII